MFTNRDLSDFYNFICGRGPVDSAKSFEEIVGLALTINRAPADHLPPDCEYVRKFPHVRGPSNGIALDKSRLATLVTAFKQAEELKFTHDNVPEIRDLARLYMRICVGLEAHHGSISEKLATELTEDAFHLIAERWPTAKNEETKIAMKYARDLLNERISNAYGFCIEEGWLDVDECIPEGVRTCEGDNYFFKILPSGREVLLQPVIAPLSPEAIEAGKDIIAQIVGIKARFSPDVPREVPKWRDEMPHDAHVLRELFAQTERIGKDRGEYIEADVYNLKSAVGKALRNPEQREIANLLRDAQGSDRGRKMIERWLILWDDNGKRIRGIIRLRKIPKAAPQIHPKFTTKAP
ncbi:MAG TPA: hypothetical protein VKX17_13840 [Planctomycetota bacterium]|nr:hypothetical protein [Planctomycetota bacterium]